MMQASSPELPDPVSSIPAEDSLSGEAILSATPIYVADAASHPKHKNKAFVRRNRLKDLWLIPIFLESDVERSPYGALAIYPSPEAGDYRLGDEETVLLCGLRQLVEKRCPELDGGRTATKLELGRLPEEPSSNFWPRVASSITEVLGFDGCAVFVVDRTDELIRRVGAFGVDISREYPGAVLPGGRVEYRIRQSGTGHIFAARETVVSQNYYEEEWYHGPPKEKFPSHYGTTLLGTPVFETPNGRIIGIIRANDKRLTSEPNGAQQVNPDDIARIEAVASELSPIVQHYLYSEDNRVLWALASHDVRAPINVIRDAAGTVLARYQTSVRQGTPSGLSRDDRRDLENIVHNTGLLQLLVDMLGTTAEEEAEIKYHFEWFPLFRKSISNIVSLLEPSANNAGVRFMAGGFGAFPRMWLDRRRIEMALYNLFINAIKYSYKGTVINVSWEMGNAVYLVHVANKGPGVPHDQKDDIFRPFVRAANAVEAAGEGRGLGLSMVKRVMDAHKGDVKLTKLRDPTIFTLAFPKGLCDEPPTQ
jgi:signal transduction histidine kinase